MSIQWVKDNASAASGPFPDASSLILENIELEDMPVDIVALGPLTNLASVLKEDPGIPLADLVGQVQGGGGFIQQDQ